MITENLSTLKIHKLTQEQYDRELQAGRIDENALYLTPDDGSGVLNVKLDWNSMTCSHSASEIIEASWSGKTIIINGDLSYVYDGWYDNDDSRIAMFLHTHLEYDGLLYQQYVYVHDDKSLSEEYNYDKYAVNVVTVNIDDVASMNSEEIDNIIWYNGVVVLYYGGAVFDFQYFYYDEEVDNYYAYFMSEQSNGNTKFTIIVNIDVNGNVSWVSEAIQPIVPAPEESDVGKVLVAGSDNQVYWEDVASSDILHVELDWNKRTCSHSASEIIEAYWSGKTIIVNNELVYNYDGWSWSDNDNSMVAHILYTYPAYYWDGTCHQEYIFIYDDKSFTYESYYDNHTVFVVYADGNFANYGYDEIMDRVYDGTPVKLNYYNNIYDYQYAANNLAYFICEQSDGNTKYTGVVTVDADGNVSDVNNVFQPMVPEPESSDVGKVLVASSNGQVSWGDTSEFASKSEVADQIEKAIANLDIAPAYTYGTADLTAGSSILETGKLYFVYE